jgi:hypothetical protein
MPTFKEEKLKEFDHWYAPVVGMHDYEHTRHDARRDFLSQALDEQKARAIALAQSYVGYETQPIETLVESLKQNL